MDIQLLSVPYDSGHRGVRMGAGPEHLLHAGMDDRLRQAGHTVKVGRVEAPLADPPGEISTAFALNVNLAKQVRRARDHRHLPIVLAGNCITAVGTWGGLGTDNTGVVWFDSHGDFNTPETTIGGFLDGMALATATGRCWPELAMGVPGFQPVPEAAVLLLGTRDLDPLEADLLEGSAVTLLSPELVRDALEPALDALATRVDSVYLHIDLDVLDPSQGRANAFAAPNGLMLEETTAILRRIGGQFTVAAAAFTAYDPAHDPAGDVSRAAFTLVETVVGVASGTG